MDILFTGKYRYTIHIIAWVGVWLFFVYFFSYRAGITTYVLTFSTVLLPITAATTYMVAYFLIPTFLLTKKILWFGIYLLFTLLFTTFCILLMLILSVAYMPNLTVEDVTPVSRHFIFIIILVYFIVALISFLNLWRQHMQIASRNSALQQKFLETQILLKEQELDYLKMQIHPHFLFNTLNTIYGFALKQSKDAPAVILKLSGLLDYTLYQVKKPAVKLQQEINHIQQYIDLEKIRFQDTLKVSFETDVVNEHMPIAPMIFLPFVENAFKHGCQIDDVLTVEIKISSTDDNLHFHIENTFHFTRTKPGIGLKNIKKRLALLYPGTHVLHITPEENCFTVDLNIILQNTNLYA